MPQGFYGNMQRTKDRRPTDAIGIYKAPERLAIQGKLSDNTGPRPDSTEPGQMGDFREKRRERRKEAERTVFSPGA